MRHDRHFYLHSHFIQDNVLEPSSAVDGMLTLWLLFGVFSSHNGICAPVRSNSQTTEHYTSWHSEPNTRGTFSILCTCTVTMSLCVWTALHLNNTDERDKVKHPILEKSEFGRIIIADRLDGYWWVCWHQSLSSIPHGHNIELLEL
jgi:hypothetical protein